MTKFSRRKALGALLLPGAVAGIPAAAAPDGAGSGRTGPYDVRNFGAVWSGQSNPLSNRFTTLAAARQVYPHAVSLDDEIDWAATQAAIDRIALDWAAAGGRYGGTVRLPGGTGRFNRALFYPANPVWVWMNFPVVNIAGEGRTATLLDWRDNDAPVHDGFVLQPRVVSVRDGRVFWSGDHRELHADCRLTGFTLRGPGSWRNWRAPVDDAEFVTRFGFRTLKWTESFNPHNPSVGQVYETLSGISAGERTCVEDVFLSGFHVGLNWRGGQKTARLVFTQNCHYGVRLTFSSGAHGDFVMEKCNFSGRFAAIALAPDAAWYGHMDSCYVGGAPFAIYKEGSPEKLSDDDAAEQIGGHWRDLMSGVWTHCQFERVGNAIVAEGNRTRRHEIRDLTLQNCLFRDVRGADFSLPSGNGRRGFIPSASLIDVGRWRRVSILRSHDPDRWRPGDEAIFRAELPPEDVVIDSADAFLGAAAVGGRSVFRVASGTSYGRVRLTGDGWSGALFPAPSAGRPEIAEGDLVGRYGEGTGLTTHGSDLVGVARETNFDPSSDQHLVVATETTGWIDINMEPGAPPAPAGSGWRLSDSTPGKATRATAETAVGAAISGPDGQWRCTLRR